MTFFAAVLIVRRNRAASPVQKTRPMIDLQSPMPKATATAKMSDGAFRAAPRRVALAIAMVVTCTLAARPAPAHAQSAGGNSAGGNWQTGTQIERKAPEAPSGPVPPAPNAGWGDNSNVTVMPRQNADPKAKPAIGQVTLSAVLVEDGAPIEEGMVWRAFQAETGAATAGGKPRLVGTWRDANPTVQLAPGEYLLNASFGRAHLTRRVTIAPGAAQKEQFVLNAGGARVQTVLANGEAVPAGAVSYDIVATDSEQTAGRAKLISAGKPGLIVRLNAGVYQVVSTYGDTNSIVRADVTVDAGKLSEVTLAHHAAKVTFKLVTRPGGEAIADTQWSLQTPHGETVRESQGALPSHILAAGAYVLVAKNGGRTYRREFTLPAGDPVQVEVVMQ